jgi:hypothetical protein
VVSAYRRSSMRYWLLQTELKWEVPGDTLCRASRRIACRGIQIDNKSGNVREPRMFLFGKSEHPGGDRRLKGFHRSTMKGQVCFSSCLHRLRFLLSGETSHGRIAPIDSLDQDPSR